MQVSYRCGCGRMSGIINVGKRCSNCFTIVRERNEFGNPVERVDHQSRQQVSQQPTIINVPNLAEDKK